MKNQLFQLKDEFNRDPLLRVLAWTVVLSTVGSLLVNLVSGAVFDSELASWWERWLMMISGNLLSALLIIIAVKRILNQETVETDSQPQSPIEEFLVKLRTAANSNARQPILDDLKSKGLLKGADLSNLDLRGANLYDADLVGASLMNCDLRGAFMIEANLQGARFNGANLEKAELSWTDLKSAVFDHANLHSAWLLRANLEGAFFTSAHFNTRTRLPDGKLWSSGLDMERYTRATHPEFWRPDRGFFGELPRWYRRAEKQAVKS